MYNIDKLNSVLFEKEVEYEDENEYIVRDYVDEIIDIEVMCEYKDIVYIIETLKLHNHYHEETREGWFDNTHTLKYYSYRHILYNKTNNTYLSFVCDKKIGDYNRNCSFMDDFYRTHFSLSFCKDKDGIEDCILIEHVPYVYDNCDKYFIDLYDFNFNKLSSIELNNNDDITNYNPRVFYNKRKRLEFIDNNISADASDFDNFRFPKNCVYKSRNNKLSNNYTNVNNEFQNDLMVVKNDIGEYGVINKNNIKLFEYNPNIINIKILSDKLLLITNNRFEMAIYNVYSGYINDFSKEIFDVNMILPDIYDIQTIDDKHKLVINNEVKNDSLCDYIEVISDSVIGLRNGDSIRLVDNNYNDIAISDNYFNIDNNVYSFNKQLFKCKVYKKES